MEVRAELKYTKSHEWVKEEGGVWTIGLTDYAQSALGDLVFVNLPEAGDSVEAGEVFGDVEKTGNGIVYPARGVARRSGARGRQQDCRGNPPAACRRGH